MMCVYAGLIISCILTTSNSNPISPGSDPIAPDAIPEATSNIFTIPSRNPITPSSIPINSLNRQLATTTGLPRPTNCSTAAQDGIVEFGCWGYVQCTNGSVTRYRCPENQVFERDLKACVDADKANTDCPKKIDCTGRDSGMYADLEDHCQTYIWCLGGADLARLYCSANLVFNETIQSCDYPYNVEPPCGTKVVIGK